MLNGPLISCESAKKFKEFTDITPENLNKIKFKAATVNGNATVVNVILRVVYKHLQGVCVSVF